jgi:hypothetical protein
MINYDTLFDDENKDLLAKLEEESAGVLGRMGLENLGRGEMNSANQGMPKYNSPFGENSLFFEPNNEDYVKFINFKILIPHIIDNVGKETSYYYRWFESHKKVPDGFFKAEDSFDKLVNEIGESLGEEEEEDTNPTLKEIRKIISNSIKTPLFKHPVDEYYIDEKGNPIFLRGMLNKKEGIIKFNLNFITFRFELDAAKRIISFTDYFHYVDTKTDMPKKEWAIKLEANRYENYLQLSNVEKLWLKKPSIENITQKFTEALKVATNDAQTIFWLYDKMPDFVFLQRNKILLIDDLQTMLQGRVREGFVNEEAIVLKILSTFNTDKKADQDNLLCELGSRFIEKQTLFEVLYEKMNNVFGADNWTATIKLLYKIWIASSYAEQKHYPYTGQPERLAYQSKKILGFYTSGFDFSFEQNKIEVKIESDTAVSETQVGEGALSLDQMNTKRIHFISYDFFQPITLQEISQEGELLLPDKIPAFYLKAFDDKKKWENYEKDAWIALDIVITLTAVGNLARLRYLTYLSKTGKVVKLVSGSLFLASSVLQTMLNFVNDCSEGTFCAKLRKYLFWVDLATIGVDIIAGRMLRKSAREALDVADSKVPAEIRAHLNDIALEASVYRSKKLVELAKAADNIIKEIAEFEAKNINSQVEVGLIYNKAKKVEIFIGSGQIKTIVLDAKQVAKLRGSIVTHIHPNGSSFSIADLKLFFTQDIKELRAVCSDGTVFSMRNRKILMPESRFNEILEGIKKEIKKTYEVGMKQRGNIYGIEILTTERLVEKLGGLMEYLMFK